MTKLNFPAFFQAVHKVSPLPWQSTLAERLVQGGGWPDLIDLPTASGKTACIDIALFHLAWSAAQGEPWRAARRIVFVVDRRIIVDAAYQRAEKLLKALLEENLDEAMAPVSKALLQLGGESPLICQKLRGGMPREHGFALDPAQPMIITSTVDQIGSRLLFRGYGLSRYSQPIHAGLLSHDTLLLLDEAHLGRPFVETVKSIRREQARAESPPAPAQLLKIVPLSATAQTNGERFQLTAADLKNPLIKQRRSAPKITRLIATSAKPPERLNRLVEWTLELRKSVDAPTPAIAVIVNRVKTARDLFEALKSKLDDGTELSLMIGRSRALDRDDLSKELLQRVAAGRDAIASDKPVIVVATQTIEVGADLDFHALVTECASLDALRQRFGRLDRLGTFRRAQAVILGGGDSNDDPVYGEALNNTWDWLTKTGSRAGHETTIDFSIESMEITLNGVNLSDLIGRDPEQLSLTPNHVQLLCQTDPRPLYDPDVSALLHGLNTSPADLQIVWRDHIPPKMIGDYLSIDPRAGSLVNDLLRLMPPSSLEALSLPIHSVKAWLSESGRPLDVSDLVATHAEEEESRPAKRAVPREVWRRVSGTWQVATQADLRPGDTIVVPSSFGGCDKYGFAPHSMAAVIDLNQRAREKLAREQVIVLTKEQLQSQFDPAVAGAVTAAWDDVQKIYKDEDCTAEEIRQYLKNALTERSLDLPIPADYQVEGLVYPAGQLYALICRSGKLGADDISDEDLSSSLTVPVSLNEHNRNVGQRARDLAASIGLDKALQSTLGCAGDVHDLGKAEPRFQRLLRGGDEITSAGELLAKGLRRRRHIRVDPCERHEAYTVALLKAYPDLLQPASDPELAEYLSGSHHGRGRALMPFTPDDGARLEVALENGKRLEFDGAPALGSLGSGWADLFWKLNKRYGPWGLAYLESILRLADHIQSRKEAERKRTHV